MSWLSAKPVSLLLILTLALGTLGTLTYRSFHQSTALHYGNIESDFQMGFYDLMSQQKEIYNVSIQTTRGVLMTNITSPDDSRFALKGKFTPTQRKQGRVYFNLTPIFYNAEHKGLMIDGLVDQLMYSNYWMEPISYRNKSLIVGQDGAIVPYSAVQ